MKKKNDKSRLVYTKPQLTEIKLKARVSLMDYSGPLLYSPNEKDHYA